MGKLLCGKHQGDMGLPLVFLQGLGEQKRTKYKINGTATTAIEKSNPNRPAKSRLPYGLPLVL